ncbi:hypothetical protein [Pedobacter duraquae]|nr:hypothetical protein [Pedobacter duraquae]
MKYPLIIASLMLLTILTHGQTNIKQSELQGFSIGKRMEKHEPQNVRYKDGKPLSAGSYVVLMDQEGRNAQGMKVSFQVNNTGKIDGEMNFDLPDKTFEIRGLYKNDTLVRVDKKINGMLVESNYFDGDVFYEKEFEDNGDFKSESRSRNGKTFYSKRMNLSGWDIQDEIKGTRTFYYGKTDRIQSRSYGKNLGKGITAMEEKFDEKGMLINKEINYADGRKKTINRDGSYELLTPSNSGDKISEYSSKGKLLKTYNAVYPTMSVQ